MSDNNGDDYSHGNGEKNLVQTQLKGVNRVGFDTQKEESNPEHSGLVDIGSALDQAITRKFDRHIVPWLFGLWLLAFIDRSNIGNARLDGLEKDLKLAGDRFNIVSRELRAISRVNKAVRL